MFVDFEREFNTDPDEFPQPLFDYYSKELPEGLKYQKVAPGMIAIANFEKIGGIKPVITEKMKNALGDNYTAQDLFSYAHNSQTTIEFKPIKPGVFLLNGKEVDAKAIVKFSDDRFLENSGSFFMQPRHFNPPFEIEVTGNGCKRKLLFQQQPYESANVSKFGNVDDDVLRISILIDRTPGAQTSYNIALQIENSKSVGDTVEAIKIYNALVNGEGTIIGHHIETKSNKSGIPEDVIEFWEKVGKIENKCNCHFVMTTEAISYDIAYEIERIYQNLIKKKPVKEWRQIDSVTLPLKGNNIEEIRKEANSEHNAFQYVTRYVIDIFETHLELPTIACMYETSYTVRKERGKDSVKISFINDKRYTTALSFSTQEEMDDFIRKHDGYIKELEDYIDVRKIVE